MGKTILVEPGGDIVRNQFADSTTGAIFIHSAPAALCQHVEWALTTTLNANANLKWTPESFGGGHRATVDWRGPVGTAAQLTGTLREWKSIVFEITEHASDGVDGERFAYVPSLGLWRGSTSANGDTIVGEMQLRALIAQHPRGAGLEGALDGVLGEAWDQALEPYRLGGAGAEITQLNKKIG